MHSTRADDRRRIVLAITGASGAVFGLRLLELLHDARAHVETHLMISAAGWLTIDEELGPDSRNPAPLESTAREASDGEPRSLRERFESLADVVHPVRDIGACAASGSWQSAGMIIAPCSMRTLAAIATGLSDNLITRSADVMLKERRRLVLMTREAPLNLVHLRNMCTVTEMGAIVYPPVPAFYQRPESIADIVDHCCGRVLDLFDIPQSVSPPWAGRRAATSSSPAWNGTP